MKTTINHLIRNPIGVVTLVTTLGLVLANQSIAQQLVPLYEFTQREGSTNSDGSNPIGGVILSDNKLYGTTLQGGADGVGTLYGVNTDGTGFTNLHNFGASTNDGASPGGLMLCSNTLIGVTAGGGSSGAGTVFSINTDGSGYTILHTFSAGTKMSTGFGGFTYINSDGLGPQGSLVLSSNTLYGTTTEGGSTGMGTIFRIGVDGSDFNVVHVFSQGEDIGSAEYTNADGAFPEGGLVLSGSTLYGTAPKGGSAASGTVYAVQTDGTGFTNLHDFSAFHLTNSDGASPVGSLVILGDTLYGTALQGGMGGTNATGGMGTIFAIGKDGTGFTVLHQFTGGSADGRDPYSGLLLLGNTLYGTTEVSGPANNGTIYSIGTDGSGFTVLNGFTNLETNVLSCFAGVVSSGYIFYGTVRASGGAAHDAVFRLSVAPQLNLNTSRTNMVLTWPTSLASFDYSGFTLQSSTNPASPTSWTPVSPAPASVNGQFVVTNAISGTQKFYRLKLAQ